jgi:hypothetical protein
VEKMIPSPSFLLQVFSISDKRLNSAIRFDRQYFKRFDDSEYAIYLHDRGSDFMHDNNLFNYLYMDCMVKLAAEM